MGLTTTSPLVLPTRRVLVFTSSQTWTVPSSALYVDVMVVGGGCGGQGGMGASPSYGEVGGSGGGITTQKDISLSGVSTVSIVVGAGSNGTAGTTTGSAGATPSQASYSAFGTYVYSGGGFAGNGAGGMPAYKGTNNYPYNGGDSTVTNFAPILYTPIPNTATTNMIYPQLQQAYSSSGTTSQYFMTQGNSLEGTAIGSSGGWGGQNSGGSGAGYAGGIAGGSNPNRSNTSLYIASQTLPWGAASIFTLGTPSAGAVAGAAGGLAGPIGYAGGGGGGGGGNVAGGLGANGAGGGGAGSSTTNGGAGGNAGTNTGSGGGGGGSGNGTGGAGGNGAAGFVIVSYIGTN
jgi:hypothetical protein